MTDQLIIQGLPDIDEVELHRFISSRRAGHLLDSCVVIRDRETKRPRGFGFLQFADPPAARKFRDEWRDGLDLNGYRLRIDFSRDSRADGTSWICDNSNCKASNFARREVCFKCERPRPETDFSKDTGSLPSQFLQLRDLPLDTTPQQINTAMTKLQGVSNGSGSIRRILAVEGREAEHVPIAFVEFQDSNVAARTLALAANLPGKGFSIRGKPVGLSFIHGGVFIPVYGNVEPGVFKATDSNQLLAYWNPEYHCSVYFPEGAIPETQEVQETEEEGSKKRKETAESSTNTNKRKKTKQQPLATGVTTKSGSGGMISLWSKRQDELNGGETPSSTTTTTAAATTATVEQDVRFADLSILACLLCSRKFKSQVELEQHENQSDLHKTNLANPLMLSKAHDRVKARRPVVEPLEKIGEKTKSGESTTSVHEYRDRALERRIQIKQSGGTVERPTSRKQQQQPPPPSIHRDLSSQDASLDKIGGGGGETKGAKLMSKMGYVSGGLGTSGQGRADIVKAETYLPGAGLGSTGAKLNEKEAEARRGASSYSAFVASVKENARARYENERRVE